MFMKLLARMLIVAIIFSAQVQSAHAVAVVIPIGRAIAQTPAGKKIISTAAQGVIGTIVAGWAIYNGARLVPPNTDGSESNPSDFPSNIKVPSNPKLPLDPPAGWSPATPAQTSAGDINPNPPSTVPLAPSYKAQIAGCSLYYLDLGAAEFCQKSAFAAQWFQYSTHSCSRTSLTVSLASYTCTATATATNPQGVVVKSHYITIGAPYACPAGYVVNATGCSLANKALVPYPEPTSSDAATCDIVRTGNAYAVNSRNPACAAASPVLNGANGGHVVVSPAGDSVFIETADGRKVVIVTDPLTGKQTMVASYPDPATNTTKVVTTELGAPDPVTGDTPVTGQKEEVKQGTGTATSPASTTPVVVDFPTDYTRENTQQQVKAGIDLLNQTLNPLDAPQDSAIDVNQELDTKLNSRDSFAADIADISSGVFALPALPDFFQPFQPAACTPLSWTFNTSAALGGGSRTATFDLCPYVETIRAVGGYALYLFTAASMFGMLTRRPSEA